MTAAVIYLPGAEDDVLAAHAEYETHLEGLGDRFARAIPGSSRANRKHA